MQEKVLNLPANKSANVHRSVLEDQEEKNMKEIKGMEAKQDWKSSNKTQMKKLKKDEKIKKLPRASC